MRCSIWICAAALWFRVAIAALSAQTLPVSLEEISDGDYAHFGEVALTDMKNAGDIANLGVVIGRDAVAVIDTGGSVAVGRDLLAAVRQITDKPLRYVINTHEHPDHVFGNAAFVADGVTFVGHHNLPQSLRMHFPFYQQSYRIPLGSAAIEEVQLVTPSLLVQDDLDLDLGDRILHLQAWSPSAHSDCDLTVLDTRTHILFAGDLVFIDHLPVIDTSLTGWLSVLPRLAAVPAAFVLPGHGRRIAPWPAALDDEQRYLSTLRRDARRLVAGGASISTAVAQIGLSERARWLMFEAYNARNATVAFSEMEWE